jgi:hypothetical protein
MCRGTAKHAGLDDFDWSAWPHMPEVLRAGMGGQSFVSGCPEKPKCGARRHLHDNLDNCKA